MIKKPRVKVEKAVADRGRKRAAPTDAAVPGLEAPFAARQSEMLAHQSKTGHRVPGRARIERIIATAIELLGEHKRGDVSIAMIATHAGMTRTSVYAHFVSVDQIFEQVAVRFVEQSGLSVVSYVQKRNPGSLEEVVTLTIDAIQEFFNRSDPDTPGALAAHVPFDARHVVKDFDRVSALPYHTLWTVDWPIEPLSEDDPFRLLVILQSALFETSIQRHGTITDNFADEAKEMALDLIGRVENKYKTNSQAKTPNAEIPT